MKKLYRVYYRDTLNKGDPSTEKWRSTAYPRAKANMVARNLGQMGCVDIDIVEVDEEKEAA